MNTKQNRRSHFAVAVALAAAVASGIGVVALAFGQSAGESSSIRPGSSYLTVGLLDRIPLGVLFLLMVVVVLGSIWSGLLAGARRRRERQHEGEGPVGTVVGAILGLLAFTLAFTFGIASNRFDLRKQVLLDEAESRSSRCGPIPALGSSRICSSEPRTSG